MIGAFLIGTIGLITGIFVGSWLKENEPVLHVSFRWRKRSYCNRADIKVDPATLK